jgi:ABC-2 type transport system ATP-binding protein
MNPIINTAVTVKGLEKKFGSFTAVDKISFDVNKGEIFGFLGPNGAGKSTTIKMLCGILSPTSGEGHVGGYDIYKEQDSIKQNIGYMSQRFSLYGDLTVEENINFFSGIYRIPASKKKERKEWVMKMADLEDLRSNRTSILSGGWKQRLALGCAIIHEPKILFLDEPTSGVDPISRQKFWEIIKDMAKNGVTVFVTTHYMDEAENCDRLALIYKGSIIASGTSEQLKSQCMREDVLQIVLPEPSEWLDKLGEIEGVREVALFGMNLHVIVSDISKTVSLIDSAFAKASIKDYTINKIKPSLEDVFISSIEAYDKEGGICEIYKG